MSAESDSSFPAPEPEPTRALLLAQALETCIQAERRVPGSADQIIARQPAWMRAELRRLVALADSLDAVAANALMSDDFRVAARARLMRRIAPELNPDAPRAIGDNHHDPTNTNGAWLAPVPSRNGHHPARRRRSKWLWRGSLGGLFAAALISAATITASASALPGEPLYGIKQAREELGVRLAPDEDARALALLNQANARLEETTRLLQQGRADEAAQATQRYDDALDRATTTYVVTIAEAPAEAPPDPTTGAIESRLSQQQEQLQTLLASAPEPARADLHEALVATERSRALMGDSKPADMRASRPRQGVAAPTAGSDAAPTSTPPAPETPRPTDVVAQPTLAPVVASVADRHDDTGRADDGRDGQQGTPPAAALDRAPESTTSARPAATESRRRQGSNADNVQAAPGPTEMADPGPAENGDQNAQALQQARREDGRTPSTPVDAGRAADVRPPEADRVEQSGQNQNSGRDRVADVPTASPPAAVAQRQSPAPSQASRQSDGNHDAADNTPRPSTPASQVTAQGSQDGQAGAVTTDSNQRFSGSRDGGGNPQTTTTTTTATPPAPATTARTSASASTPDDHSDGGRDASARGQGGGTSIVARSVTTTSAPSNTPSNSTPQSGFSSRATSFTTQTNGGGSRDSSGGTRDGAGGSRFGGR